MNTKALPLSVILVLFIGFSTMTFAQRDAPEYDLLLKSGIVNVPANVLHMDPNQPIGTENTFNGKVYRILQFTEVPSLESQKALKSLGIQLLNYLPHNAYMVSAPVSLKLEKLLPFKVRSVLQVLPSWKIDPLLSGNSYPAHAMVEPGFLDLHVKYYQDVPSTMASELITKNGAVLVSHNSFAHMLTVRIPVFEVNDLIALPWVSWVEAVAEIGEPEDLKGRSMHRSHNLYNPYGAGRKYDGEGVTLVINDDGFVGPHIDFQGRDEQSDVEGDLAGNHGDMTAGIAVGAGNINPEFRGQAPGADLIVRQYNSNMPNTIDLHTESGAMVFSTSYSNGCNAGYTAVTQMIDMEINSYPTLIQVFSAGNSNGANCGYGAGNQWGNITGGHKIAKNVLATANLTNKEVLITSSSRGPAQDGRIKPDISANGDGQMSTDSDNMYQVGGGTSAAAPSVGGVFAQLYQAYRELNADQDPESALMKAVVLNTAEDLGNVGPDFTYGWGRINGLRAVRVLEENRYFSDSLAMGETNTHTLTIPSNVSEARIMVYWRDPAAGILTSKALVNDLNMQMEDMGGTVFDPWYLDPTPNATILASPATRGTLDDLNNVEQVMIENPVAGDYSLDINGALVPMGVQEYWVTWEFLMNGIEVTYPIGGEGFIPTGGQLIRWEASKSTETFTVDYSTDNMATWSTAALNINADLRYFDWTVSGTDTKEGFIRIIRGSDTAVSPAPFHIMMRPFSINVDYVCPDSLGISWNSVAGATEYDVFMLGDKYMDSVDVSPTNSHAFYGLSPNEEHWFSVRSYNADGARSERAIAIRQAPGVFNCPIDEDISLNEVVRPVTTLIECFTSSTMAVEVQVENTGLNPITGFDVSYIADGGATVTESYTGTLAPGATDVYVFSATVDFSSPIAHTLQTWVSLPSDGNSWNDTIYQVTNVLPGTTVAWPFSENFESFDTCSTVFDCGATVCPLSNGFLNLDNGTEDDHDWRITFGPTPTADTGPTADHNPGSTLGKYAYMEPSNGCELATALMYTPCIEIPATAADPEMTFWFHMFGSDIGQLRVDVFADEVWNLDVSIPLIGDQFNVWRQRIVNLTPWKGKTVLCRFRGVTGTGFEGDIAIDDINFNVALVNRDLDIAGPQIQLYPNPSEGKFTLDIQANTSAQIQVEALDIMGSKVFSQTLPATGNEIKSTLDLGEVPSGVYFIKVSGDGWNEVKKIQIF